MRVDRLEVCVCVCVGYRLMMVEEQQVSAELFLVAAPERCD